MRLAELRAMTPEKWRALRQEMRQARKLPKLNEHFRKHGKSFEDLGVVDAKQMQALFLAHLRRSDLEAFTYIATQKATQYRQWVLVGMDNGVVAIYNESKRRYWTFMHQSELAEYLNGGRGWWLKVDNLGDKAQVRRW